MTKQNVYNESLDKFLAKKKRIINLLNTSEFFHKHRLRYYESGETKLVVYIATPSNVVAIFKHRNYDIFYKRIVRNIFFKHLREDTFNIEEG